ncbi:MAG TPA: BamA/TamA family outer membrane protein [Acidiphilium sp.]|nr:MAG: outer membrane protein assembly factor [Acidiphilium sp. 21-60-14]OYV91534.1 MAG: outer membrane protein assembly factor [Acidiphilium sp. 37-60-79]HQT87143.1 BamA/TamA family outer membrane protein [Acidiphilium sp.]HQU23671.1 BamA/TamA family outer membrane protein [Acidiphilium sp.]
MKRLSERALIIAVTISLCLFGLGIGVACAANPQPYRVTLSKTGNAALDTLLRKSAQLETLRTKLKVSPFALIGRAQADQKRLLTVLHSEAYDSGTVAITINGLALNNPSLPSLLRRAPAQPPAQVVVKIALGPMYTISAIKTPGLTNPVPVPALGIAVGATARAAPIIDARAHLQATLRNHGYAFAKVDPPIAYANITRHTLTVQYTVQQGPRVAVGAIQFSGAPALQRAFLARHILLRAGQPFSETALAKARNQLLALRVFSSVSAKTASTPNPPGQVPITFLLQAEKPHRVEIGASYSTDQGISADASWTDRNLFGRAQRLKFSIGATGLGSSTGKSIVLQPGYDAKAAYKVPDAFQPGQTFTADIGALRAYLPAYNRTGVLANIGLERPWSKYIDLRYGLGYIGEQVRQEGISRRYNLVQLPLSLRYDTTHSLLNPTQGMRITLRITPSVPLSGGSGVFLNTELIGNTYINLEAPGRGVLALRGVLGRIFGASQFQIPPDQRFYAGGTGTVRGFTYQTVGPLFANGVPQGGTAIDAAEIEFRQRIGKSFGIAPFVDAGQVAANGTPFTGTPRVGVGIGLLYFTRIGPIRLDLGVPVNRPPGGASFAVYIGLGQAF